MSTYVHELLYLHYVDMGMDVLNIILGARTLLGAPGIATRNKKLGAPGLTARSEDATRNKEHRYYFLDSWRHPIFCAEPVWSGGRRCLKMIPPTRHGVNLSLSLSVWHPKTRHPHQSACV